jgi:hypothetical protein
VYKEKVFTQICQLLSMASVPIITDCSVELPGTSKVVIFPDPIPDLFLGAPLTLSGRYEGEITGPVLLKGKTTNSAQVVIECQAFQSTVIPVQKVLVQQEISLMTAHAWLEEDKEGEEAVVDLSCEQSVASAYTSMVAYERVKGEQEDEEKEGKVALSKEELRKLRTLQVSTVVLGGAIVVAAASFSFGDVFRTADNLSPLGDGGGVDGCCQMCACCGEGEQNCCCDSGDCLTC